MSAPNGKQISAAWLFDELADIINERNSQTWRADAACLGLDPDLFFQDNSYDEATRAAAIAVCETCPVQTECREYALSKPPMKVKGVWGATTERKRTAMKAERKALVDA